MPVYEVDVGGKIYEIDAPNEQGVMAAIQSLGPIKQGDWSGLKGRIDQAENNFMGPMRPEDREFVRQEEARRQGAMYGATRPPGETAERQGFNTFTLGAGRLAESYLPSWAGGQSALPGAEAHEFIKSADDARSTTNPIASALGTGAGIVGQIAVTPATTAKTVAGRLAQAMGLGGAMAGTEAAIDTRGDMAKAGVATALGGAGGLAGGVIGEKIGSMVAGANAKRVAEKLAPSADDLANRSAQKYAEAEAAGVWFKPNAYANFVNDVKQTLSKEGVDETLHKNVMAAVGRLEKETGNAVTLGKMDILRRVAQSAAKSREPDESRLGSILIDKLDEFVEGAGPQTVVFGNGPQGAAALKEARATYAANARAKRMEDAIEMGKIRAETSGSGANVDNTTRQEFRKILTSKNASRGLNAEEKAAVKEAASGTIVRNLARSLGKAAPTGIVSSGISAALGGSLGGVPGALALMGAGATGKAIADRGTMKAAEFAANLARLRAADPAALEAVRRAANPDQRRLALIMALMGSQGAAAGSQLVPQ